jgi:hypothetical protein
VRVPGPTIGLLLAAYATLRLGPRESPQVAPTPSVFSIHLESPARAGLPAWIDADLSGLLTVHYPYGTDPGFIGSNQLAVTRDGHPLDRLPDDQPIAPIPGLVIGSLAPPDAPTGRLPLHLIYDLSTPGHYSVRWTVVAQRDPRQDPPSAPDRVLAQSAWLDFDIAPTTEADRQAWLTRLLAASPSTVGAYVGDYIPSLLAAPLDPRVAMAVFRGLGVPAIAEYVRGATRLFPARIAEPAVIASLSERPGRWLGIFITLHPTWFENDREAIARAATANIRSPNDDLAAAGLELAGAVLTWPPEDPTRRELAATIVAAAPGLLTRSRLLAQTALLRLLQVREAGARELLWQVVDGGGPYAQSALDNLVRAGDPRAVAIVETQLLSSGDPDASGADRVRTVINLVVGQADGGVPALRRILFESPYPLVRVQAAEELARLDVGDGYQFLINVVAGSASYREDVISWLARWLHPPVVDAATLTKLLEDKIRQAKPRQVGNPQIPGLIEMLRSLRADDRKTAARSLQNIAGTSPASRSDVGSALFAVARQPIGPGPDEINAESWRDAVLILARLPFGTNTLGLLMRLDRDGAADALIERGSDVVPAVAEILDVGSMDHRRISARVLGAIGTPAARGALEGALQRERDPSVGDEIRHALSHLGERGPLAEIR